MANKKKIATATTAVALAAALLLGGTFAWQSISQTALNEKEAVINPGGRLHDAFNGTNKDVYVENFADDEIYARVRLDEYFEIIMNKNTPAEKTEVITTGANKDDVNTYLTHKFDAENATDDWWNWTTGGSTVYMPTFNKNKDSLKADINGTYENDYDDYVEYTDGQEVTADATYDNDSNNVEDDGVVKVEEKHTATETGTAKFISMAEWIELAEDGEETDNYWVYDTDGWVYYSSPIKSGTATGLLLDEISLKGVMDDSYYYAINVVGQFITADDLGKDDNTGFYADGESVTENALTLLKKIGVKVDNDTADDEEETIDYQTLVLSTTCSNTIALSEDLETNKLIKLVDEEGNELTKDDIMLFDATEEYLTENVDYTFENGYLKILKMTFPIIYVSNTEFDQMAQIVLPVNPDSDYAILPLDEKLSENYDLLSFINLKVNQSMTLYLDEVGEYMISNPYIFGVREYGVGKITELDKSSYTFKNNQLTITDSKYVGKIIEVHYEQGTGGEKCASAYFYILPEDN